MAHLYTVLGIVSVLLVLSVLASKAAVRLGVPTLLLFLAIGIAAGSEGVGGIWFDYPRAVQMAGVVALIYILYAAGLDTRAQEFRSQMWPAVSLATLGVLISCAFVAIFAHYLLRFSWAEGALLGAVVSATDAAAVFSVLRSKGTNLRPGLRHLLEAESGSNDPMAVFLTFAAIAAIQNPRTSFADHIGHFVLQMGVGGCIGYFGGKLVATAINRIRLQWEGLYPVLSIGLVLLLFTICSLLKGNGFLAVYLAGLVVGNTTLIHRRSLLLFHDAIAWLLQIAMFLILGLQVFPSQLLTVVQGGVLITIFLIVVARPLSVAAALAPFHFGLREQIFIAWAGLRGAAPIILAVFAVTSGVQQASTIFNTVFFVAVLSVAVQGTTIDRAATWLGVTHPEAQPSRPPLRYDASALPNKATVEFEVSPSSVASGKRILDLPLQRGTLILLLARNGDYIVPDGSTILRSGDVVQVLADATSIENTQRLFKPDERQG
jgi:cell volume regulation protein A